MRYLSVCAGIEAASVAWHPLGWRAAAFSEIEPFPRAVLRHDWPDIPIHGRDRAKGETFEDHAAEAGFQTIGADDYGAIDLLVGGTPCQSFSVAGKRGGMADGRGNLALEYIRLAHRKRPRWVVWENVPGVFSSNGGEDFRCFLAGLVRWNVPIPDGGWSNAGIVAAGPADGAFGVAWRVLDAQFAGVPQRRRRVFVVGYIGDWRRAAAVLFERHGLQGHPAPRREKGQRPASTISARPSGGGGLGTDFDLDGGLITAARMVAFGEYEDDGTALTVKQRDYKDATDLVAHALRTEGFDASEDGTGRGTPLVPVAIRTANTTANGHGIADDVAHTLDGAQGQAVAYDLRGRDGGSQMEGPHDTANIRAGSGGSSRSYIAFSAKDDGRDVSDDLAPTLRCGGKDGGPNWTAVAFDTFNPTEADTAHTIRSGAGSEGVPATLQACAVRRLTPRECERRQGFPDDYTRIAWPGWRDMDPDETPDECREAGLDVKQTAGGKWRVKDVDGPRYKALGNSMAVPVMRWIGERIQAVEYLRLNDAVQPGLESVGPCGAPFQANRDAR